MEKANSACRATLDHVSRYCVHTTHYVQPKILGPMSLLTSLERDPLFEKKKKNYFFIYYVVNAIRCIL
jgi:hypothetical protein